MIWFFICLNDSNRIIEFEDIFDIYCYFVYFILCFDCVFENLMFVYYYFDIEV